MGAYPDFDVYGGTWVKYKPTEGTLGEPSKCEKCGDECGHRFFSFAASDENREIERYVRYTISTDRTCIAQDIKDSGHAQLMGLAPDLARMLKKIADSDPINSDTGWHDMGTPYCFYCGVTEDSFPPGSPKSFPHTKDCLWRQAVETLERLKDRPRVWGVHDMTVSGGAVGGDQP